MRRFFLALRVRLQVVPRSLPDVIQLVQRATQRVVGNLAPRGDFQDFLEQGDRPAHVRAAQVLRREGQEGLQQMLVVLVQCTMTSRPLPVSQRLGVMALGVGPDPVVDTLPRHTEHTGDVSGGAALIELQNGQGTPQQAGVQGFLELAPQAASLPGGEIESAHVLLLDH
jgi:hypothetical protein